jgi:ABC-type sugar transport system substrate-binding protein
MDLASKQIAGEVKFEKVDGGGDPQKQIKAVDDAIGKKPQVLMVSPIDESVLPELARAKSAGIFVFQLDRCYVPWTTNKSPCNSFYGADLPGIASGAPFYYVSNLRQKGTGLIVPDSSADGQELLLGMQSSIKAKFKGNITTVMGEDCGTDENKAKAFVASYLKSGKPVDVIFTMNDAATLGAAEAVKEAGVKKYIFGVGNGSKEVYDAVKDGTVYATSFIPPGGPTALGAVPSALKHERIPKNSFIPSGMILQKNVDQYLKDSSVPAS